MGDGQGEEDGEGDDGHEGGDKERQADFGEGLRFIAARGAVVVARGAAADDAEDDAARGEEFGESYVSGRDERVVALVDVGLDSAEQAAREIFPVSNFFSLDKGRKTLCFRP